MSEAPKQIWLHHYDDRWNTSISFEDLGGNEIKYVRADRYAAMLDAAVSLHHWLFELVHNADADTPDVFADAQLALDKWDRFLDGKEG